MSSAFESNWACSSESHGHAAWVPPSILLEASDGDDSLIVELIDAFHSDTISRLDAMRSAIERGDLERFRREAHTIKGGARQVGADYVADLCQEIELTCAGMTPAEQSANVNQLASRFRTQYHQMEQYAERAGKQILSS